MACLRQIKSYCFCNAFGIENIIYTRYTKRYTGPKELRGALRLSNKAINLTTTPTTISKVQNVMKNMPPKMKPPGHDQITYKMLKKLPLIAEVLYTLLRYGYNR